MTRKTNGRPFWLASIVLVHLAASLVHGAAHTAAHVVTSPIQNAFILIVIGIGPLAGLWLSGIRRSAGGWLVAATMAGSLLFGIANHYVIAGVDRVDHVAGPWAPLFAASAAILAITETAGTGAGIWYATRRMEHAS